MRGAGAVPTGFATTPPQSGDFPMSILAGTTANAMPPVGPQRLPKEQLLGEALEELATYNLPIIHGLLQRYGFRRLPLAGNREMQLATIKNALDAGLISGEELLDYVDEQREFGRQSLFLYRPCERHTPLKELTDALRRRLEALDLARLYNGRRTVWEADKPTLAAVVREEAPCPGISVMWVETRRWHKHVEVPVVGGAKSFRIEPREERSVSFCRVDGRTGIVELRIQTLRPRPDPSMNEERERYERVIVDLLGFNDLTLVMMGPVIRRWLVLSPLNVLAWRVTQPNGSPLSGRGTPRVLAKLGLFRHKLFPLFLAGEWGFHGNLRVRLTLDARWDQLDLATECTEKQAREILSRVLRDHNDVIETPELARLVADKPAMQLVCRRLDYWLGGRRRHRFDSARLAAQERLRPEEVEGAFEALHRAAPRKFALSYYLRCPETRLHASFKGVRLVFPTRASIPPDFSCDHGRESCSHISRDNVVILLEVREDAITDSIWRRGVVSTVLWLVGLDKLRSLARRLIEGIVLFGFSLLYILLLVWGYDKVLALMERHQANPIVGKSAAGLLVLALLAVYVAFVGAENIDTVKELFWKLVGNLVVKILRAGAEFLRELRKFMDLVLRRPRPRPPAQPPPSREQ